MQSNQSLLIKDILIEGIKMGASDLHFSVGNKPVLRVNQNLVFLEDREVIVSEFMEALIGSWLDAKAKATLESNREIIFTYDFDKELRFKINIFYQKGYLSATFRHIPSRVPTIDSLGLVPVLKSLTAFKKGLILVAGPFGSGRSTTAAAMIEEINQSRKEYVITIENPIEYIFTNSKSIIEQREVGKDTKSFEEALKYFQEEDGDVLFLQEMGDPKIVPLVLEIANGSSLVISAVNADSASKAISSILDNFTSLDQERIRDLLSNSLRAVVCQRILPKSGGGVIAVQEIMVVNEAIKSIIANGNISQLDNIIQVSKKEGMISFNQALAELVQARKINMQDALAESPDRKSLEGTLNS